MMNILLLHFCPWFCFFNIYHQCGNERCSTDGDLCVSEERAFLQEGNFDIMKYANLS